MPATSIRPSNPEPVSLTSIARLLGQPEADLPEIAVTGVAMSSRDVADGDLYVGIPGARVHGAKFASDAIEQGARAVLTDAAGSVLVKQAHLAVPVIETDDPRAVLGTVSGLVYGTTANDPVLYGVTGTNGKTSCAYMLAAVIEQLGRRPGLSTTVERRIGDERVESALTSPEASDMHALIARMREVGVDAAAIEVSAQALTRHRVEGLVFDTVGFLNLAHDHLDEYASFDDYFDAKLQLFTPAHARRGVVSLDSEWGRQLADRAEIPVTTIACSADAGADWRVDVLDASGPSTEFELTAPDGQTLRTRVPLPGWFSAANAGMSIAMLVTSGIPFDEIRSALERDGEIRVTVPGRTELLNPGGGPKFYLDYGHTPEAFRQTLKALRALTPGRLFMIFGADGDRDATKRPEMGRVSAELADEVIITDYNPRTEDPAAIRAVLLDAAREAAPEKTIREIPNAAEGIRAAVAAASEGDTILIAGPGHETHSEVGGQKIEYSARDEAVRALREAGWPA